jgi:hypothetical protein
VGKETVLHQTKDFTAIANDVGVTIDFFTDSIRGEYTDIAAVLSDQSCRIFRVC